jgi:cation diffusion facilitator family transporter
MSLTPTGPAPVETPRPPTAYLKLSVAAAVATIALKLTAWQLTDSVGLMSDALESFVNLAGAGFALWMVAIARTPPDPGHPFGHSKAEYFSSGFEGLLILGAAVAIALSAAERFASPRPLLALDLGLVLASGASAINFAVARVLHKAAKRHRSIALDGDARHLMTDVWTSLGVLVGLGVAGLTGLPWLDPLLALLVAANIAREAIRLIRESGEGLLDAALPAADLALIDATLDAFTSAEIAFVEVRTHRAGHSSFLTAKLLVPGHWTVDQAHMLSDRVEAALASKLPHLGAVFHVEPRAGLD